VTEETKVQREQDDLPLSDPDELMATAGQPLPKKAHVFRPRGEKPMRVLLGGLTYAEKSIEDIQGNEAKAEAKLKGVIEADLRGPRILARAMLTPEGKRKYTTEEAITLAACRIAEWGDGEVNRGYNVVMDLSGYSKDALEQAEKN
jgi:hypothetical protein